MLKNLLVFDIETVPDTDACYGLTGKVSDDVNELREAMIQYHLEITDGKNQFLRQPFWKIVAISCLEASIETGGNKEIYTFKRLYSNRDDNEANIVRGFFEYFAKLKPRLVSFNGRTFDLPVLKYRAMKYGVDIPFLYKSGDKWNNYNHRYSTDWHCDLIDVLSDYGTSARIKMHEVCAILGFPGKFGTDGSKVQDMFDAGKIKDIKNYCETDVINTYLLYLRTMHLHGTIDKKCYNTCIDDMQSYLENENSQHLKDFLQSWQECSKNAIHL